MKYFMLKLQRGPAAWFLCCFHLCSSSVIIKAMKDMKRREVAGQSGIAAEMLKISGQLGYVITTYMINEVIQEGLISNDWCHCKLLQRR